MTDKITGNAIGNSAIVTSLIADSSITEIKLADASIDINAILPAIVEKIRVVKLTTVTLPTGTVADSNGGQLITLGGEGFAPGMRVFLGNIECTAAYVNSEAVTFFTPAMTPGTYWITVNNPDGSTVSKPDAITFEGPPIWVTPAGNIGVVTNTIPSQITVTAIPGSISYSLDSGSLPPGISLANTGVISGNLIAIADLASSYFFSVRATRPNGLFTSRNFIIRTTAQFTIERVIYPGNNQAASSLGGDQLAIVGTGFGNLTLSIQGTSISYTRANSNFISFTMPPASQSNISLGANTRTESYTFSSNGFYTFSSNLEGNLEVIMWGAGGATSGQSGGAGGASRGYIPVRPGTTYYVVVGQGGQAGAATPKLVGFPGRGGTGTLSVGGSGGGFSGIFANGISQSNALIMAGGGGGGTPFGLGAAGGGTSGQNVTNGVLEGTFSGNTLSLTTSGLYLLYLPPNLSSTTVDVNVKMWGAGGGNSSVATLGGGGGYSVGNFTAYTGIPYYIVVGTGGANATAANLSMAGTFGGGGPGATGSSGNGGGGGGFSGIFVNSITQANALIIAGGAAGSNTFQGGAGGGPSGQDGNASRFGGNFSEFGRGGTQLAGGGGGGGADTSGTAGNVFQGGNGVPVGGGWVGGSGGGGGWFGGGGGASGGGSHGAGGGGSGYINLSFITSGNTITGSGNVAANSLDPVRAGAGNPGANGAVIITFSRVITYTYTGPLGGSQVVGGLGNFANIAIGTQGLALAGGYARDHTVPGYSGAGGGGSGYFGGGAGGTGANSTTLGSMVSYPLSIKTSSGAGGSGYINTNVVIAGNTQTGNFATPADNTNPIRGSAGNPGTDGLVILNLTYPSSTNAILTNPDGTSSNVSLRYSFINVLTPRFTPFYMTTVNDTISNANIRVAGNLAVTYALDRSYAPWLTLNSNTGTFTFQPSVAISSGYSTGNYRTNVSITNADNFTLTKTYNVLLSQTMFANLVIEYLAVGGGGGGGTYGGGGAGGLTGGTLFANIVSNLDTLNFSIIVGQGGVSGVNATPGMPTTITRNNNLLVQAFGGGAGGVFYGDGGGDGASTGGGSINGLASTSNTVGQGNRGGAGNFGAAGGGGGANAAGTPASNISQTVFTGGAGGIGSSAYSAWGLATGTGQNVSGVVYYAGGGGGIGIDYTPNPPTYTTGNVGGLGGGGNAAVGTDSFVSSFANVSGLATSGGGGGAVTPVAGNLAASGGSGIVIFRYTGNQTATGGTVTSSGGFTYHTFIRDGTFIPYGLYTENFTVLPPSWNSPAAGNLGIYTPNDSFITNLSATGTIFGNASYVVTTGNLPSGLAVNANSGTISGIFAANSSGNNVFTISAIDPGGISTTRSFFIFVRGARPVITSITSNSSPVAGNISSGDFVTITGNNFQNGATVFLRNAAVSTTFISSNTLTFITPIFTADLDYDEGGNALVGISNWTPTTTFFMTNFGNVANVTAHGHSPSTTFTFAYNNLPIHDQIRYSLRWHLVDSLDGETSFLNIDGVRYLTFTKVYNAAPSVSFSLLANNSFTVSSYSYRPWGGGSFGQDGYITVDTGWINHTAANINVAHFIGADQAATDEAMYLSNVRLQTRSLSGALAGQTTTISVLNPDNVQSANSIVAISASPPTWITGEGYLGVFSDVNFSTNIIIYTSTATNVTVVSGSLPPGLSATVTTNSNLTISGNILSNAAPLYDFTLRMTDSSQRTSVDRSFSCSVAFAPKIYNLIAPPGGFFDPLYGEVATIIGQDFVTGCNVIINNTVVTSTYVNNQCLTFSTTGEPYSSFSVGGTLTYGAAGYYSWTVPSGVRLAFVYLWGAGGGGGGPGGWSFGAPGGAGGAARGLITLTPGTTIFITVGGPGAYASTVSAAGGGGRASVNGADNRYGAGGGGYSAIFSSNTWTQGNTIIMAGGGGGGGSSRAGTGNQGGAGGGLIGQDGVAPYDNKTAYRGLGGTQTAAGADASSDSANTAGNQGALQGGNPRTNAYGGAGGGGYWGGSAGGYTEPNTMGGGGGGSGYLNPARVLDGVLTGGNLLIPGDNLNTLRGTAGNPGAVASTGSPGKVVIVYYNGGYLSNAYNLQVVNADGIASQNSTFVYTAPPFFITTNALGTAFLGTAFYVNLAILGDNPVTFSIIDNPKSLQLILNAITGNLTIIPGESALGTANFTLRATDANLQYSDKQFTLTTVKAPVITGITYPLTANANVFLSNSILTSVSVTGTAGQFSTVPGSITAGDRIVITGTPIRSDCITGYTDSKSYFVATVSGGNFTLSNNIIGDTVTTTAGNTTGLIFTRIPFVANPSSNVFSSYGGETVRINGFNFISGSRVTMSNITAISGNAIVRLPLPTQYISSSILEFTTPTFEPGFYNLTLINPDGTTVSAPTNMRFTTPPYWVTGFNLGVAGSLTNFNSNVFATAESNVTYTFWNNTSIDSNITLNSQTGQISGTPLALGIVNFSVAATNEEGQYAVKDFVLTKGAQYTIQYVVVGGGGAGGQPTNPGAPALGGVGGGGGGAVLSASTIVLSGTSYVISVAGAAANGGMQAGGSTAFGTFAGGGASGNYISGGYGGVQTTGPNGGGGGGGNGWFGTVQPGGTSSGGFGAGGDGYSPNIPAVTGGLMAGGGGGGAQKTPVAATGGGSGGGGMPGNSVGAGDGGGGAAWLNGVKYGGGGGGFYWYGPNGSTGLGSGYDGAGGVGGVALANRGGGGSGNTGQNGGSGVVVIRYLGAQTTQTGGTVTTPGDGYTYHTFTTSGNFVA